MLGLTYIAIELLFASTADAQARVSQVIPGLRRVDLRGGLDEAMIDRIECGITGIRPKRASSVGNGDTA
ncbi:MAG: hypothetical protein H0U59_10195 [Gemmatimonadaceae bacterium]|nr:hypothetical protein [Gemmatimonadaceae bacterium]